MTAPHRIAVVEDEADLAELLAYNLRRAGYEVELARDGADGLRLIREGLPDLAILDIMIPNLSGLQIARQVRTNPATATIPILFLTAKAEEVDQITGLQAGGDDYITKPFSVKVLMARVEALLRRTKAGAPAGAAGTGSVLEFEGVEADLSRHEVRVRGKAAHLTVTEFRLLTALMRGRGRVLNRADLMATAMGPDVMVTARTIDVHMAAIRRKLGPCGDLIRTVRGVGYIMSERGGPGAPEPVRDAAMNG